jgi:hypothetical protein
LKRAHSVTFITFSIADIDDNRVAMVPVNACHFEGEPARRLVQILRRLHISTTLSFMSMGPRGRG